MKALIFADVHGNATALRAVLNREQDFDFVVFLGDAVSPGPQPNETIELLAGLNGIFIAGNHEQTITNPELIANWPDGYRALMNWEYENLETAAMQFLSEFQRPGEYVVAGEKTILAHGDESNYARHVLPGMPNAAFKPLNHGSTSLSVFFGHSHIQFRQTIRNQEFVNPGSVGQNRCGHVVACYGLLTDGVYTQHYVEYDPKPWLKAVDQIEPLSKFESFRDWFKQGTSSGFTAGKKEPWLRLAKLGFR